MEIKLDNNSVVVASEGVDILCLHDFPVSELIEQLSSWLELVTEENAKCFIFESPDIDQLGIFRIEPRPGGWQFTSVKESKRSGELLSLEEWRGILSNAL